VPTALVTVVVDVLSSDESESSESSDEAVVPVDVGLDVPAAVDVPEAVGLAANADIVNVRIIIRLSNNVKLFFIKSSLVFYWFRL
jgi:hypothetical protein